MMSSHDVCLGQFVIFRQRAFVSYVSMHGLSVAHQLPWPDGDLKTPSNAQREEDAWQLAIGRCCHALVGQRFTLEAFSISNQLLWSTNKFSYSKLPMSDPCYQLLYCRPADLPLLLLVFRWKVPLCLKHGLVVVSFPATQQIVARHNECFRNAKTYLAASVFEGRILPQWSPDFHRVVCVHALLYVDKYWD